MAGFDGNISVTILVDQPAISPAGFGIPLLAATGLGMGFTQRLRLYTDPEQVATDLLAGDITQAVADALNDGFSQELHVQTQAVGRVEADVSQVDTVTFAGTTATAAETFDISINGVAYQFVAVGGETPAALAAAIAPLVNADPNVSAIDSGGGVVTITALIAGEPFTTGVSTNSATITMTPATTTPNGSIKTELDAIKFDSPVFYAVHPSSRDATQIQRAAEWAKLNGHLLLGQSSDADNLTTATTSIMDLLKTALNDYAGVVYHADDTEWVAWSELCYTLEANPDERVTLWAYKRLANQTPQVQLSATEIANIQAKNGNVYSTFGESGAFGMGRLASGLPIDIRTTVDWLKSRITTNWQNLFLSTSGRNERLPYADPGLAAVGGEVERVLARGEIIGHFNPDSSVVTVPRAADVDPIKKSPLREADVSFSTVATGAIEKANVRGIVRQS